jgi:hypothetical protein
MRPSFGGFSTPRPPGLLVVACLKGVVAMEEPYSVVADWLSKFHTWPEFIQALWLVAVPVTVLGVTWLVMRGVRDTVAAWRTGSRNEMQGRLIYGVFENAAGQLLVWRHGEVREIAGEHSSQAAELIANSISRP